MSAGKAQAAFKDRWLIRGRLVLTAPLRLATGDAEAREMGRGADDDGGALAAEEATPKVALVHRAADGRPMIPGSSLKGVLRHFIESRLGEADKERLWPVFGREAHTVEGKEEKISTGGKAEFHDAIADWNAVRGDAGEPPALPVVARTAIDRATRTAERRKLFHGEQVPAGTGFRVAITGDNLERDELVLLLTALEGFNEGAGALPLSLGGGGTSGKGRAAWHLDEMRRMDRAAIGRWLARPEPCPWIDHITADPDCRADAAGLREKARQRLARLAAPAFVRAEIEIAFEGPFLVKDPGRQRPSAKHDAADDEKEAEPSLPRLDAEGQVLLPGESVKGALRAQAERICRTIGVAVSGVDASPVVLLFGDTRQRGRLAVEDFRRADGRGVASQQFVAIDRFTGGQAHGKLYEFEHADRPVMRGALTLGLAAADADATGLEAALGLLALLLQDLIEGDITLGLGAAKGYGACRARIVGITVGGTPPAAPAARLAEAAAAGWPVAGPSLGELYGPATTAWVGALHDEAKEAPGVAAAAEQPGPDAAAGDAAARRAGGGAAGGDDG